MNPKEAFDKLQKMHHDLEAALQARVTELEAEVRELEAERDAAFAEVHRLRDERGDLEAARIRGDSYERKWHGAEAEIRRLEREKAQEATSAAEWKRAAKEWQKRAEKAERALNPEDYR